MVLDIVKYGHPTLRTKGEKIKRIDDELRELVDDMLDTMRAANGVGLAAQQVDRALQLTVIDITEVEDRPSQMWINGEAVEVAEYMPMVLINPVVEPDGNPDTGVEGCLSFPEISADITRPSRVAVKARNLDGELIEFTADGLLSRAVQHEVDHLNGVLFIDRMNSAVKAGLKSKLKRLREQFDEH